KGSLRAEIALHQAPPGDVHRRGDVERVARATAPDLAVDQLAGEGIMPPAGRRDRDDVGVAHEVERRRSGIAARDAKHEARAARYGLVAFELRARKPQVAFEEIDAADLVTGGRRPVVHAAIADELLKEV